MIDGDICGVVGGVVCGVVGGCGGGDCIYFLCAGADEDMDGGIDCLFGNSGEERRVVVYITSIKVFYAAQIVFVQHGMV